MTRALTSAVSCVPDDIRRAAMEAIAQLDRPVEELLTMQQWHVAAAHDPERVTAAPPARVECGQGALFEVLA